tara:strand:+ start:67 stop:1158 length:1092 start_codon:yes stop_codon:yes gene_type:complete
MSITEILQQNFEQKDVIPEGFLESVQTHDEQTMVYHLDTIMVKNTRWGAKKAIIASIVSKLAFPDWDNRKHQIQIGGDQSLRCIDSKHICPFFFTKEIYETDTTFALTRSFEKPEPFNLDYSGKISPKSVKIAFLQIIDTINTYHDNEALCLYALRYIIKILQDLSTPCQINVFNGDDSDISLYKINSILLQLTKIKMSGGSRIAPILVYCVLKTAYPWKEKITLEPLELHTASDKHTGKVGDIQGTDLLGNICMAIEVKSNIEITDMIQKTFENKMKDHENIRHKWILTTKPVKLTINSGNIQVWNVVLYVVNILSNALLVNEQVFHEFLDTFQEIIKEKLRYNRPLLMVTLECLASELHGE